MEIHLAHLLTLILGVVMSPCSAGVMEDLAGVRTEVTSVLNIPECADPFERNRSTSTETNFAEVRENSIVENVLDDRVLCCVLSQLQACVIENIGRNQGLDVEGRTDAILKEIINSQEFMIKKLTVEMRCNWEAWYFRENSPLCWSLYFLVQMALAFSFLIGIITSCLVRKMLAKKLL